MRRERELKVGERERNCGNDRARRRRGKEKGKRR